MFLKNLITFSNAVINNCCGEKMAEPTNDDDFLAFYLISTSASRAFYIHISIKFVQLLMMFNFPLIQMKICIRITFSS